MSEREKESRVKVAIDKIEDVLLKWWDISHMKQQGIQSHAYCVLKS